MSHRVNKLFRRCDACGGKLVWDGDDAKEFNANMDDWYMWHKSVFGLTGWFSKDYWRGEFNTTT